MVYAYALEEVEHEARLRGTSLSEARAHFDMLIASQEPDTPEGPSAEQIDQQSAVQAQLMAAMGRARG